MRGAWVIAFLVNLFLLGSVFDIHFKSPIVHVSNSHRAVLDNSPSSLKRLVFFVADGLRGDTFFNNPHLRPYLSSVMSKKDGGVAVGISDTRVPTESRPGHIALFAGFYEDPSAVFTGWKNNLVEFDSVFNQSKGSIALGSPDVVNMFAQGEAKSKMYSETYPSDWQDFLEGNSSVLDTWVFDKFKILAEQQRLPRHDNLIIFLHLLGIDNTGHATKPHSREYESGLTVVDDIVAKVENLMESYYGDKDTLFVFTSDHGMTDWGSHGSGSVEETETPIVIWGPGIKNTANLRINQADIAALVAGSLGSAFPSNSVGKFPIQIWNDQSFAYANLRSNFLQVMELSKTKKGRVSSERNFPLVEFPDEEMLMQVLPNMDKLMKDGNIADAIIGLDLAFEEALQANVYYERYSQTLMIFFSFATFLLLMILVASSVLSLESDRDLSYRSSFSLHLKLLLWGFGIGTLITKGIIGWSLWKVGYCFIPTYLCFLLNHEFRQQKIALRQKAKLVWSLSLSILGVLLLLLSFWERSVLSGILLLNLVWVLKSHTKKNGRMKRGDFILHLVAVVILALFPAVPIIGRARSPFFTTIGPLVSCGMAVVGLVFLGGSGGLQSAEDQLVLATQLFLQVSPAVLSHFPSFMGTRLLAWTSLLLSLICPMLTSSTMVVLRLLSIFLALGTPFSFLGISYETLFFPALFLVLLLFLKLEIGEEFGEVTERKKWPEFLTLSRQEPLMRRNNKQEMVNIHRAFRRAWLHLFFVFLSFFGTGNIGSVSSFDPSSTRCFVSVFSPWVMMLLMLVKILAPFLLVSSFWRALLPSARDVERNFGILLLFCQAMSLVMFFKVRNTGSWLDIGMSISHFVIVQATTLFLLLFHFIAHYLVTRELLGPPADLPTTKIDLTSSQKRL